ncbi:hypothetical protein LMJF_14_1250 [Leishmania major strain Friedlin]|uniref:Uncharacterized protein n=1 Tax=Leishmania major TaxID=5664 RepID=Q4QFK9_LEIMA|nr:hypothetical protein LMJF_14_1250 [Leishmania major strain Friedlin]CAG9571319.1 hypothetical_protein_-_conserved [Leishmania major strain Friedlin]CAJ03199.1 hypothetical protein LMJF_14_1250 [Leishmania major strain Friedlin]|eukprot:XP_001687725.1 hypothetical protein LMJF_14_1250 [Leishmania major strain Friedlin]
MTSCETNSSRRPAPLALGVVVSVALLLLGLCGVPAQAATVTDLKNAIKNELYRIDIGMTDFYSSLSVSPTVQQQYCTAAITSRAAGLSLTMESLSSPYGVLATEYGFLIYKDTFVFGPSIKLIGASAWPNGTLTTDIQSGRHILVPYLTNTVVFVTGVIENEDGRQNILPMMRLMMVDSYLCAHMHMNVANLYRKTFRTAFAELA